MNFIAVDDEQLALNDLRQAIENAVPECSLSCFRTPHKALEFAKDCNVDVAFLDIQMGGMNGLELAIKLKNIRPQANIVFVTGYSHYAVDAFMVPASGYILKPVSPNSVLLAMDTLRHPVLHSDKIVRIQTFGNFEVFVNNKPLQISRSKAKELLAYLVDRRGASVTMAQAAAVLWEDKNYSRTVLKQVQTVVSQLMKILKAAGIEHIIIKKMEQHRRGCQ